MVINVLLVDDHEIVLAGLCRLLSDENSIKVVGLARSGEEAIQLAREKSPDVVLMDVKMPGIGGLEATRKMLHVNDRLKVIILTVYSEPPMPAKLLKAGAYGYLTKGATTKDMVSAIRTVYSGQRYLSADVAQQLALSNVINQERPVLDSLSPRELQVMLMITQGQTVNNISSRLCLSPKTINSYRYRLFEKLGVTSDVELTHMALRYGILDTEQIS